MPSARGRRRLRLFGLAFGCLAAAALVLAAGAAGSPKFPAGLSWVATVLSISGAIVAFASVRGPFEDS